MPELTPVVTDAIQRSFVIGRMAGIFLKIRWWHLVILFFMATLYWLVPITNGLSPKEIEALGGQDLRIAERAVSGKHGTPPVPSGIVVAVNPLVRGTVSAGIDWDAEGVTHSNPAITTELRVDNLILMWGLCLGMIIALASAKPERQSRSGYQMKTAKVEPQVLTTLASTASITAEQTLAEDVISAGVRAADVYRRSTFLLAGGILMAFVGVSVFAVTVPTDFRSERAGYELERERYEYNLLRSLRDGPPTSSTQVADAINEIERTLRAEQQARQPESIYPALLARALRPFGMLLFVEGIAWFLLRQYRSLIEDYKGFVRVQLRRSSYLIALRAALENSEGISHAEVIQTMLREDLTGRLPKDQTTEAIEALKFREEGPILESIKELRDLVKSKAASGI